MSQSAAQPWALSRLACRSKIVVGTVYPPTGSSGRNCLGGLEQISAEVGSHDLEVRRVAALRPDLDRALAVAADFTGVDDVLLVGPRILDQDELRRKAVTPLVGRCERDTGDPHRCSAIRSNSVQLAPRKGAAPRRREELAT